MPAPYNSISHLRIVFSQSLVTDEVLHHSYPGSGTPEDPYRIEFIPHDPRNPKTWRKWKKWLVTVTCAVATLAVTFASSAFTGGITEMMEAFGVGTELVTLGVSLFVLGFAIGPLLWGPLSELYGRQILYFVTFAGLTAFNAGMFNWMSARCRLVHDAQKSFYALGAAGAQNIQTLLILRFFAGAIGSSPLTNSGGVIADMFECVPCYLCCSLRLVKSKTLSANERGLGMAIFSSAPFLGPAIGPIVGGFLGETEGWRWVEGLMAIFTGVLWIAGSLIIPETYAPVLLRRRATKLSEITGKVYLSQLDYDRGKQTFSRTMSIALSRPWKLLIREPIVFLLSLYMAISKFHYDNGIRRLSPANEHKMISVYGTLYLCFGAFPIVYQEERGWSQGVGALPFIGVVIGMMSGVLYVCVVPLDISTKPPLIRSYSV